MKKQGYFLTLEGIEGAGKSTQQIFIRDLLINEGRDVLATREPGGTNLGEKLRDILLQKDTVAISGEAELLMMFAARQQHLTEVIKPALANGKIVVCDRFADSSRAYQCGGRGVDSLKCDQLIQWVHPDLAPDLTLLFDLPAETGLHRARATGDADRFEAETLGFFQAVRESYLRAAAAEPDRFRVLNADLSMEEVQAEIRQVLKEEGLC